MRTNESFMDIYYEAMNTFGYDRNEMLNRLRAAHERELGQARNPSHELMRETRDEETRKLELMREYDRGYGDGKRAYQRKCEQALREGFGFSKAAYNVLDEERRKAVRELRKLSDRGNALRRELDMALGLDLRADNDALCDRLIYLLGGDECNFSTPESDMDTETAEHRPAETPDTDGDNVTSGTRSVTAELRECVEAATKTYDNTYWHDMGADTEDMHTWCSVTVAELLGIADRIDAEVDGLRHDATMWRDRAEDMRMERDESEGFARRVEAAVEAEEDVTLFGVDYTPRDLVRDAENDHLLTETYKELRQALGRAKHLRDKLAAHTKTMAQVEAERDSLREEVASLKRAAERDADVMESLNLSLEEAEARRCQCLVRDKNGEPITVGAKVRLPGRDKGTVTGITVGLNGCGFVDVRSDKLDKILVYSVDDVIVIDKQAEGDAYERP